MELSPREREILAQIEDELRSEEQLARTMDSEPAEQPTVLRTWLLLAGLLGLGLLAVILVSVLLLDLSPVGVGLLTGAVIVPWSAYAFVRLNRDRGRH